MGLAGTEEGHFMSKPISAERVKEFQAIIDAGEAGFLGIPSWHVFEWLCWKERLKHPPMLNCRCVVMTGI